MLQVEIKHRDVVNRCDRILESPPFLDIHEQHDSIIAVCEGVISQPQGTLRKQDPHDLHACIEQHIQAGPNNHTVIWGLEVG